MTARIRTAGGALATSLRDRRIRGVQLAWCATITAEWAVIVALAVWAFDTGGALGIGVVTVARTLPAAILGPFLAPLADRFRRDGVLVVATVARAALVGGLAVAVLAGAPRTVVLAVAALDATVYSLYWPAQSSLLAEVARRPEQLVAANVASTTIENVGALAGPVLAAATLAVGSPGVTLATAAGLLALGLLPLAPLLRDHRHGAPLGEDAGVLAGHLDGFTLLARSPRPRSIAALYLTHTLAFGALTVLVAVLALEGLRLGSSGVGALTAALGAGGILGSLAALGLVGDRHLARSFGVGILVWASATALLGALPPVAVVVVLLVVAGVTNAIVDVAALTLLQRLVPVHRLARVLGVVEGVWWGTLGAGGLLAAVVSDRAGVDVALATVGLPLAALAVLARRQLAAVDREVEVPSDRLEVLLRDPILGPLPTTELERLARTAAPVSVAAGEVVIREGDVGDRYYAVVEGTVEVTAASLRVPLGVGDGFGEIALLRDVPRTASVTSVTDVTLLAVDRVDFLTAVRGHGAVAATAERLADRRTNREEVPGP